MDLQTAETAAARLVESFYPELRRIAAAQMKGERASHTWQPTVLVNELYLELRRVKALPPDTASDEQQRASFLRLSAFLMRRMLIHHARPLARRATKIAIESLPEQPSASEPGLEEIEQVLERLAAIDPILRTVVEMKVFEGLTREQIADKLDCSVRTVASHWGFARQWLEEQLA